MALKMGIVGLPNVGKSTTFNALTKAQNAEAANYPFCTIEPNRAIVPVPDARIDTLAKMANPERVMPATIEFVDIAGLVAGASKGEGLGNKFLAHIRETAAIVHVVRCFDDENVIHVHGGCDPKRDIEIIETELLLADLEQVDRRVDRIAKLAKGDKKQQPMLDLALKLKGHLEAGRPFGTFPDQDSDEFRETLRDLQPITAKKVIFAANVDEAGLAEDNAYLQIIRGIAQERGAEVVKLCAKVEEEMAGLSDAERQEFLDSLGAEESGLDQIIHKSYHALGLISYFTVGPKEVRAWTIPVGATAPQAAGVIHTDFEKGFIRAEVIHYANYVADGGEQGAKAAGHMTAEGRDYVMQDGDVVHFRFNV
jgi:hypothetical protein